MRERFLNKKSFEAVLDGSARFVIVSAKVDEPPNIGDEICVREVDPDNPDPAGYENTMLSGNLCIVEVRWIEKMPGVEHWHVCDIKTKQYHLPYMKTREWYPDNGLEVPEA